MIGTVVVPLDGSALAEEAIPLAQTIAERSGAMLHLLQVVPADAPASTQDESREYLRTQARGIDDRVQISIRTGDPAEQIVDGAAELLDPIVVMTTRGRSGLQRWAFGSVAERVVHGAGVPVLLIRSGVARPSTIRSILVPLDGTPYSEAVLPYATALAHVFGATLHVARVVETARLYARLTPQTAGAAETIAEVVAGLVREARAYVEQRVDALRTQGLRAEPHLLQGYAAEELIALERAAGTDLTVMATRGRTGLSRMVFGSVAEQVLKLGSSPVMMVQPERVIGAGAGANAARPAVPADE